MSDIVNLSAAFAGKSEVFGTALIPMNNRDKSVYGAGTHWFVVGYETVPGRSDVVCYAADASGNGDIESADFEILSIRWEPEVTFRNVLFQICSPEGLDELIRG